MSRSARWSCALCAVVLAAGCAAPSERAVVLHDSLTRDNRDLALRAPVEVMARFSRMADDPFSFLRGSIGLWARDVTTPGGPGAGPTAFGDGVAAGILLVGDPHPENIGTARIDGGLLAGWNDFDVSRFGPAVLDVRRLALAQGVFTTGLTDDDGLPERAVREMARGYADGITGAHEDCIDRDDVLGDDEAWGRLIKRVFQDAREEGGAREEEELLILPDDGGAPRLDVQDQRPTALDAELLVRVSAAEAGRLTDALASEGLKAREVARVVGRGVGSRPLLRWIVLLDDNSLVQVKEARDSFVLPGYAAAHDRFFGDNAERVVFARQALLGHDGADARLRTINLAPLGAFTTTETGFAQRVRRGDVLDALESGALTVDDITRFAYESGRMLAWAHRRGVDVDGDPTHITLPAALNLLPPERAQALADETWEVTRDSLPTALDDHLLLGELLDAHGPLLGLATEAHR